MRYFVLMGLATVLALAVSSCGGGGGASRGPNPWQGTYGGYLAAVGYNYGEVHIDANGKITGYHETSYGSRCSWWGSISWEGRFSMRCNCGYSPYSGQGMVVNGQRGLKFDSRSIGSDVILHELAHPRQE